jgi:hypothetical protein
MKNWKILILVIGFLVAAAVGGRLYARHGALSFGQRLGQAFSVLGRQGFANTTALRGFFSEPEMAGYVSCVRQLSFLGGRYDERLSDLQTGMIYYSEQASLSPEIRFAAPPALKHLTINSGDRSDAGLAEAAGNLISSFASQL